ncbi:MAG: amidohydrolase family protein [Bacteroidetes Order II. Incertae sedis bacterium]|jgi:L-fuconolactonase|nr:amidohydrolase family protein [Bacteroidetes Order II. bacterium]
MGITKDTVVEILDSHVHFWDPRSTPRAVSPLVKLLGFQPKLMYWVAKKVFPKEAVDFFASPEYILKPHLPSDIEKEQQSFRVKGVVHVEASWEGRDSLACVDETKWLETLSTAGGPPISAIVAHANLSLGSEVGDILVRHLDASSRVRGIRDALSWHPNPNVLDGGDRPQLSKEPDWRRGFEKLSELGLHFEATVYANQLSEIAGLATEYPDQKILLCHLGTPVGGGGPFAGVGMTDAERTTVVDNWKEEISRLAECPNVYIKLSGLSMPVVGFGYEKRASPPRLEEIAEGIRPFVSTAINAFGSNRCMFGSNYPIDKVSLPYGHLVDAYRAVLGDHHDANLDAVFRCTAEDFYGLSSQ